MEFFKMLPTTFFENINQMKLCKYFQKGKKI